MGVKLEEIAFGRGAYLLFLVSIVMALAFADLPLPIFLAFLSVIVAVGLVAEALSRLASRKLEASSTPVSSFGTFEQGADESLTELLLAFGQSQKEPEFSQTQLWFANTSVGTFA